MQEAIMTHQQMYKQATSEWQRSEDVRLHYPTFVYYWHERYERVYNLDKRTRVKLFKH
jgi:hypothetical protein